MAYRNGQISHARDFFFLFGVMATFLSKLNLAYCVNVDDSTFLEESARASRVPKRSRSLLQGLDDFVTVDSDDPGHVDINVGTIEKVVHTPTPDPYEFTPPYTPLQYYSLPPTEAGASRPIAGELGGFDPGNVFAYSTAPTAAHPAPPEWHIPGKNWPPASPPWPHRPPRPPAHPTNPPGVSGDGSSYAWERNSKEMASGVQEAPEGESSELTFVLVAGVIAAFVGVVVMYHQHRLRRDNMDTTSFSSETTALSLNAELPQASPSAQPLTRQDYGSIDSANDAINL